MKHLLRALTTFSLVAVVAACSADAGNADNAKTVSGATSTAAMSESVATVGHAAPDFSLMSAEGAKHSLSEFKGKYVVLEWVNYDCPFVKKQYGAGDMQKLQEKYGDKGVVWLSICSSAPGKQGNFEGAVLTDRIKSESSNATAYLIDTDGTVGRMYGAKTTPHMFVVNPEGMLIYSGAIDDKPSTNISDRPSMNYVAQALDAAMAGKEIAVKATSSYGCGVKY